MAEPLRYTLVADGSSDKVLLRPLTWLLEQHAKPLFKGQLADLRRLPEPPHRLADRIRAALDFYPCELLFVHRDAEKEHPDQRAKEIKAALQEVRAAPIAAHVIPVQMTEAWFLFDEHAIRRAAGNPSGKSPLKLPSLRDVEQIDAKKELHQLLCDASELQGHRLQRFSPERCVHRVADLIDDFQPLRIVPSFAALEEHVRRTLCDQGWS